MSIDVVNVSGTRADIDRSGALNAKNREILALQAQARARLAKTRANFAEGMQAAKDVQRDLDWTQKKVRCAHYEQALSMRTFANGDQRIERASSAKIPTTVPSSKSKISCTRRLLGAKNDPGSFNKECNDTGAILDDITTTMRFPFTVQSLKKKRRRLDKLRSRRGPCSSTLHRATVRTTTLSSQMHERRAVVPAPYFFTGR